MGRPLCWVSQAPRQRRSCCSYDPDIVCCSPSVRQQALSDRQILEVPPRNTMPVVVGFEVSGSGITVYGIMFEGGGFVGLKASFVVHISCTTERLEQWSCVECDFYRLAFPSCDRQGWIRLIERIPLPPNSFANDILQVHSLPAKSNTPSKSEFKEMTDPKAAALSTAIVIITIPPAS